jgi:hypothetical protein
LAQAAQKTGQVWLEVFRRSAAHETDQRQGRLRAYSERPSRGYSSSAFEEIASSHYPPETQQHLSRLDYIRD